MSKLRLYDSTRLSGAKNCMRYYLLRFCYHWVPEGTSLPLVFGSSWHAATEVLWARHADLFVSRSSKLDVIDASHAAFVAKWTEEGMPHPDAMSPDDIDEFGARTPQIALEMLHAYPEAREHIFRDPAFAVVGIEQPFIVPLDPHDETLWYVGRIDKEIKWQGSTYVGIEHKTTSVYRKSGIFDSNWIDGWSMDDQLDGYSYSMHMKHGDHAAGIWIDGALVHKTIHDGFKFIPIDKQPLSLEAWLYDTRVWVDQIEANKAVLEERSKLDTPYLAAFPRNRKSCVSMYGKCAFFDLCRMQPNPAKFEGRVPAGYKVSKWEPFDELKLEKIGLSKEAVSDE